MTPGKVYGTSKLEDKIFENSWNFFFRKCANSKKNRQNSKMILNGQLSEQHLEAKFVYRKEGAKCLKREILTLNLIKTLQVISSSMIVGNTGLSD